MIDVSSVQALIASLPDSPVVQRAFLAESYPPDGIPSAAVALAQRGFLGCLPLIFKEEVETYVLRLLPAVPLDHSPLAVVPQEVNMGETLAPTIRHLVSGLFIAEAAAELANHPRYRYLGEVQAESAFEADLLALAQECGEAASFRNVLQIARDHADDDYFIRTGRAWQAMAPDHPLCQVIGATRLLQLHARYEWITAHLESYADVELIWRLYVAYHTIFKKESDIRAAAWRLVLADDVYDVTYSAVSPTTTEARERSPLVQAVTWLQEHPEPARIPVPPALWEAAQAYASDPWGYDGSLHLAFARSIADSDPRLAYTHSANAAAYFAYAREEPPIDAIRFAFELASQQGWLDLATVLGWAVDELE